MITAALEGLALGASLIIAIGAQNAYVIRQGVKGEHVFAVAMVCALIDIVLISVGAAGVGTLIAHSPVLRTGAAWGGALFLIVFGIISVRAAIAAKPGAWEKAEHDAAEHDGDERGASASRLKSTVVAAAAFSLLNPHVYLDTVVVLGGIAAQYELHARVWFALGAMSASLIWFFGIGYGATKVAPCFRTVTGTRVLETVVATIMFALAVSLIMGELR